MSVCPQGGGGTPWSCPGPVWGEEVPQTRPGVCSRQDQGVSPSLRAGPGIDSPFPGQYVSYGHARELPFIWNMLSGQFKRSVVIYK